MVCIVIGGGGITHQTLVGPVNEWLLGVFLALLGLPGGIGLWSLRGQTGATTTTESSSQSPPPSSLPQQSPSPYNASAGEP